MLICFSIGSLGRESDEGVVVEDVTVKSVTFKGTENGFRIKTFSTPIRGKVKNINFIGAYMDNVLIPIIIDQNYCPHNTCPSGQVILLPIYSYISIIYYSVFFC